MQARWNKGFGEQREVGWTGVAVVSEQRYGVQSTLYVSASTE